MKTGLSILLMSLMIFFILLLVHESSHALMGTFLGCKGIKMVLFDLVNGPHTELSCSSSNLSSLVYLSGLLMTSTLGLPFLFLKSPSRSLFFVILGISLIFSVSDLSILFKLEFHSLFTIASGFGFITTGEYFMASGYIDRTTLVNL